MGFLGIVEVPVAHLLFVEGSGQRLHNDAHRHRFADLLQYTHRVHTDVRQLIAGYIDTSETDTILRDAGTSSLKIKRQNKSGKYPFIENAIVRYTQGRHLIAAAVAVDSAARWAVGLYQTTIGRLPCSPGVRRCTEKYQHEQQHTDGQMYRKLRMYPDNGLDYNKWYNHLTEPKRIGMAAIDQRVDISLELNKLTNIPAVLDELYLTSIQKSFVSRLDEELLAGIRKLYSEWLRLARGNMNILKKMDKETVNALAGRAPRVCDKDRLFIDDMFSSRQVFSKVDNPEEREALRLRVQQSSGIIPSLLSLQSNLRFLGIAAKIIWQYLIPKSLRLKAKQSKLSLKATLRGCWTSTVPYIEIREGEFVSATGPPNFDLVYIQLFLAAIRQFPYLSCCRPKMGRGETLQFTHDPHHAALFVRRAKFLGVQTATIDENIKAFFPDGNYTQQLQFRNLPDESEVLSRLGNRWGRPSASIYWRIRQEGFLPTIVAHTAESRLSAIFVLRSTLRSCFNLPSFNIDFAQGICSLTARPKRARYGQLETITEEAELDMAANSRLGKRIRSDVPMPVAVSRSTARSGSDISMPDASPLWDARSSSDISMPDASPLWDARSSSDVSMPDASPLLDARSSSDVSMRDASFSEQTVSMTGRAVASVPVENQILAQVTTFDKSCPHSKHHGQYDTGTGQLNDSNIATFSPSNRGFRSGRSIDARQAQQLTYFQPKYSERDQSTLILPSTQKVLPSESRRQIARLEDKPSVPPCIQIGESAMTPPGSFYRTEDIHAGLPTIPTSPDRRSSMAATGQPRVGRGALLAQSNWHRESEIRAFDDTLSTTTMLEQTVPHSPCVPRRLSEFPTATIPPSVSISDLQSISSQPQFSYVHSNSASHMMPPPSLHSDTATRSSYTVPYSFCHGNDGATLTQKTQQYSSKWQGFDDSDDEYESID